MPEWLSSDWALQATLVTLGLCVVGYVLWLVFDERARKVHTPKLPDIRPSDVDGLKRYPLNYGFQEQALRHQANWSAAHEAASQRLNEAFRQMQMQDAQKRQAYGLQGKATYCGPGLPTSLQSLANGGLAGVGFPGGLLGLGLRL